MNAEPGLLGERGVSRKETEVLFLVGEHLTNAEIAKRLYVSERTVESHVSALLRKLAVASRRELASLAQTAAEQTRAAGAPVLPPALELAAQSGPLVGRTAELERLRDLWRSAAAGHTLIAVVTGEAGVGKSRLVAELAVEAHGNGGRVLFGACFEDVATPYQPFAQAICDDLAGLAPTEVRRRVAGDVASLSRVVPIPGDGAAPGEVVRPSVERDDLMDAVCGYLARTAAANPVLVVVEDLHWGTATTRDALRHLARTAGRATMLVVVTSRDTPPDVSDDLATLLGDLARYPCVQRVGLHGLNRPEVAELVAVMSEGEQDLDPGAIWDDTNGNPLLVREMVTGSAGRSVIGTSVQTLLSVRSRRLTTGDNALLELAAVVGAEFDADLIAAASDTSLVEVLEAMERAEAAGLTNQVPGRPGRFAFVHALFRSTRYDAMPTSRRLRLHHHVVSVLTPRAGDDRVIPELAYHACAAVPLVDPRTAIDYARRAGDLAAWSLAVDEAAVHYHRAIEIADLLDPPDPALRCELVVLLGEALNRLGDPAGRNLLIQAAPLARRMGDPDLLAKIAWTLSPATYGSAFYDDPDALDLAEDALGRIGPEPTPTQARLLAVLGDKHRGAVGGAHGGRAATADAVWVARQLDDPVLLGQVLTTCQWSRRNPGNLAERIAAMDELEDLGRRLGRSSFVAVAQGSRCHNLLEQGDVAGAWQANDQNEALIGDHQAIRVGLANRRTTRLYLAGDLAAAAHAAETLSTLAQTEAAVVGIDPLHYYVTHLAMIRFAQGRIADAIGVIDAAVAAHPTIVMYQAMLALTLARTGDFDAARVILGRVTDNRIASLPFNFQWYTGMVCLADAADMLGELDAAAVVEERLIPYSGRLATHATGVSQPIDIALTQLALAAGDNERANAIAESAVQASRRTYTPVFLARALVQQAAARARLGHPDGLTLAIIDEAQAIADQTGADLIKHEQHRYRLA
jgi:DNA-binding CsgD family transcriptional regulator